MSNDSFIAHALSLGNINPRRGRLWASTLTNSDEVSPGGLIIPALKEGWKNNVEAEFFEVEALGADPVEEDAKPLRKLVDGDHLVPVWTWADQSVYRGTIVAATPGAGFNQENESRYRHLWWHEIIAIGVPVWEHSPVPMLPAPGWVLVQPDEQEGMVGGIHVVNPQIEDFLRHRGGGWGEVVAMPRGCDDFHGVTVGSRVCFPKYRTTCLVVDGGLRFHRITDLLGVDE
uniref:Chaperonin n=1 Tax=viral metagenome TaxID=1070528 RepID=A0A6M3KYU5_9ZZZZ